MRRIGGVLPRRTRGFAKGIYPNRIYGDLWISEESDRKGIDGGCVPPATTSSVIAGMRAQQAAKLLYSGYVNPSPLARVGWQLVGLSHHSYTGGCGQSDDRLGHDTAVLNAGRVIVQHARLHEVPVPAPEALGDAAVGSLEHVGVVREAPTSAATSRHTTHRRRAETLGGICPERPSPPRPEAPLREQRARPPLLTSCLTDHDDDNFDIRPQAQRDK